MAKIKCAPEIFPRIMDNMLEGIQGAVAIMDDILVAGKNMKDHDVTLRKVIEKATEYNLKLNMDKCSIRQTSVTYVGHLLTADGLKPDPNKVRALLEMSTPTDKEAVRRFLGFVTYLSKFIPNLSEIDAPLRELVKTDVMFSWQPEQEQAFRKLQDMCSSTPVLAYYDVSKPVQIECDASQNGLGGVILQENRPIAYTSRSLTDTEKRYAQIEKETLSVLHACKKFHNYIFGKPVTVFNDHKPLVAIFSKPLLSVPMRLQKMRMDLQWYDITLQYRKGKDMHISDTLSRACLPESVTLSDNRNLDYCVNMLEHISVSKEKYSAIQNCTTSELSDLVSLVQNGWPDIKKEVPIALRPYWDSRDEYTVSDGVIYKGMRIVVPPSLRKTMLSLIHKSHLGMVKVKQRAREVLFWPAMNKDIEDVVRQCVQCAEFQNKVSREPLKPTPTTDLPYSEVGTDIFHFKDYLITVDYYSKFIEVDELKDLQSSTVINTLKSQFSRHGIPQKLRSDCGSQYTSQEFKRFCQDYEIIHHASSPHYQQCNGEAEKAVQTVKRMWSKAQDKHLALLDYRTTPLEGLNLSPAQLLMGRRPRNKLPSASALLIPSAHDTKEVQRHFDAEKTKQKLYYDRTAHEHSPLSPGDHVRMAPLPGKKNWLPATVVRRHELPRSYIVQSGDNKFCRNRRHLRLSTEEANASSPLTEDFPEDISSTPPLLMRFWTCLKFDQIGIIS